jgi:hypothetical protein
MKEKKWIGWVLNTSPEKLIMHDRNLSLAAVPFAHEKAFTVGSIRMPCKQKYIWKQFFYNFIPFKNTLMRPNSV